MSTDPVESMFPQPSEGDIMKDEFEVGNSVRYFSEKNGRQKFGFISHTHESVDPDGAITRPEPGFAHLVVWNVSTQHFIQYPNVPVRSMAESIPDYTVEGQLVGFFEVAS